MCICFIRPAWKAALLLCFVKSVKSSSLSITQLEIIYLCDNLPQWWNSRGSCWPLSWLALHQHHFSDSFRGVKALWGIVLHPLAWWRYCRRCAGGRSFDRGREELWIFFRDLEEVSFRGLVFLENVTRHCLHHLNFLSKMFRPKLLFRLFELLKKMRRGQDREIEKIDFKWNESKGISLCRLPFPFIWLLTFWFEDLAAVALWIFDSRGQQDAASLNQWSTVKMIFSQTGQNAKYIPQTYIKHITSMQICSWYFLCWLVHWSL